MCNIMPCPVITNVSKNALLAEAKAFGKTDRLSATEMKAKRCAELIIKTMASIVQELM